MKRAYQLDNFKLPFGLPYELIELICSYLKFNTSLFITCKALYAMPSKILCASGTHVVTLVHMIGRRMPTECLCVRRETCCDCQCYLMPVCVPTAFIGGPELAIYVCDGCFAGGTFDRPDIYGKTIAFRKLECGGMGWLPQ